MLGGPARLGEGGSGPPTTVLSGRANLSGARSAGLTQPSVLPKFELPEYPCARWVSREQNLEDWSPGKSSFLVCMC